MTARDRQVRRKTMRADDKGRVVSPSRSAAFEILRRVEEEAAYASILLASGNDAMRADDRALCYELVLGVLRRQLWLDALIEHYAGRSADDLDPPVRRTLRLGLYQLRFLTRIPASAIVNESVNLAYVARIRSAAGLINAVLRRATREADYDPASKETDPVERLAIETSHPSWLIQRWIEAFGSVETEKFARANNQTPPLAFRLGSSRSNEPDIFKRLLEAGVKFTRSHVTPDGWRVEGPIATVREMTGAGDIYLQDEASQLVTHVLDAKRDERVLDVCAAPGSKTTHIAARMPGMRLMLAGDLYEHRLRTISEIAARSGIEGIQALAYDATKPLPLQNEAFDRVLVDAPCSGTGTLRRNPEIRWRISNADISELSVKQRRILTNASHTVRRGGRLVYSTCSVEPDENEEVIATFLQDNKGFRQISVDVPVALIGPDGSVRTWPHRDGTDGFFIAAFERQQ